MEFTPVLGKKNRISAYELKEPSIDSSLIAKLLPKICNFQEKSNVKRIKVSENKLFINVPTLSTIKHRRHVLKFMSPNSQNRKKIDLKSKEEKSPMNLKCKTPNSRESFNLCRSPNFRENGSRMSFNHKVLNTSNFTKIHYPCSMPIPNVNHASVNYRKTPDLCRDSSISSNSSSSSDQLTPVFRSKFY